MRTLTNGQVARIFEDAAEAYDARSNPYTMRRRADALAACADGVTIEVGGGTAAVLRAMRDRSQTFHSDIAFPMCRVARFKVHRPSACFDAEQIPIADSCVDTVVSAEMIYYLRRPQRLVSEAFRILRPGGKLILSTTTHHDFVGTRPVELRKIGLPECFRDGSRSFLAGSVECTAH
jgi:malonyl-CoA O-methyltransferase